MKADVFARLYLSEFVRESPWQRRAVELWAWYHVVCEAFDRRVCTGGFGPDGGAMPSGSWEGSLIIANAARVHRQMVDGSVCEGVTSEDMAAGRRRVERMRLDEMDLVAVAPKATVNWSQRPVDATKNTPL